MPPQPAWLIDAPPPPQPGIAPASSCRRSEAAALPPGSQTFCIRSVSDQRDKFTYRYAALEEEQIQQVDDLIEMDPLLRDMFFCLLETQAAAGPAAPRR